MRSLTSCFALLVALLLLAGCRGEQKNQVTAADNQAFATATPELKALWDKALAADQKLDYLTAQTTLRELRDQNLTPEQRTAVLNALKADGDKLLEALNKGDAGAVKTLEAIRQIDYRRGR